MNVYTREATVGQQEQERCKEWEVSLKEDDVMRQKGYTVTGLLGEGTYSKVKRAFSKRMKRDVAVKIIAKEEAPRTFRERFLPREIAILSQIRHGNILRVYEIFELVSPQRVYIVTELMQHGDLLEKVKAKGAMRERCASLIANDVCRALAYLHSHHIAHRDVKCENILLSRRQPLEGERCLTYTAKLCDFGFARSFRPLVAGSADDHYGEEVFLVTDTFCGSAAYASPEILERRTHDARSADVWALGIVFFIVLVGSMPFDDTNIKKMVREQKKGAALNRLPARLSEPVKDLISNALQPEPLHRCSVPDLLRHPWLRRHHDDGTAASGTAAARQ